MTFNPLREQLAARQTRIGSLFEREMERRLKAAAPVRSGETRRRTTVELTTRAQARGIAPRLVWHAEVDVPYAEFPELGTRPHDIVARAGSVLAFFWPKVGRFVFFHRVRHPGNAPKPWFAPTLEKSSDLLGSLWRRL